MFLINTLILNLNIKKQKSKLFSLFLFFSIIKSVFFYFKDFYYYFQNSTYFKVIDFKGFGKIRYSQLKNLINSQVYIIEKQKNLLDHLFN